MSLVSKKTSLYKPPGLPHYKWFANRQSKESTTYQDRDSKKVFQKTKVNK